MIILPGTSKPEPVNWLSVPCWRCRKRPKNCPWLIRFRPRLFIVVVIPATKLVLVPFSVAYYYLQYLLASPYTWLLWLNPLYPGWDKWQLLCLSISFSLLQWSLLHSSWCQLFWGLMLSHCTRCSLVFPFGVLEGSSQGTVLLYWRPVFFQRMAANPFPATRSNGAINWLLFSFLQ